MTGIRRSLLWLALCASTSARGDPGGQIQFVDAAVPLGIDFQHHNGVSEERRLPETYGSGGAHR